MSIRPPSRSTPLAFPNDRVTRPARTMAWFAAQTASRNAADPWPFIAPSQTAGEVVIGLVPTDLVPECRQVERLVDEQELDPGHLGKIDQRLGVEGAGHDRVVGSPGCQPCLDGSGQVGPRPPERPRDGEPGQT